MHWLKSSAPLCLAAIILSGCGGGAPSNGQPVPSSSSSASAAAATKGSASRGAVAQYDTPQAVFAVFAEATKKNEWATAAALLSTESQTMMAAGMIMGASFMTIEDEAKEKNLQELFKKHGVDLDAESPGEADQSGPESLAKSIKDLPAFIGEIGAWMLKNQGEGADSGFPDMVELSDVRVDGDSATASVTTEDGPRPIEFRRVDGSWRIHLPMEDMEPEVDLGETDPSEAADDGTPPLGTLWIGDKPFKLRRAIAYRSKSFDEPVTVVLLTAGALSESQLGTLQKMLEEEGNDEAFFVRGPNLKATFNQEGELDFLFAWADNVSINTSGSDEVNVEFRSADGRVSGKLAIQEPQELGDSTYRFEAEFDVALTTFDAKQ